MKFFLFHKWYTSIACCLRGLFARRIRFLDPSRLSTKASGSRCPISTRAGSSGNHDRVFISSGCRRCIQERVGYRATAKRTAGDFLRAYHTQLVPATPEHHLAPVFKADRALVHPLVRRLVRRTPAVMITFTRALVAFEGHPPALHFSRPV